MDAYYGQSESSDLLRFWNLNGRPREDAPVTVLVLFSRIMELEIRLFNLYKLIGNKGTMAQRVLVVCMATHAYSTSCVGSANLMSG